jgi:hypothetical protein
MHGTIEGFAGHRTKEYRGMLTFLKNLSIKAKIFWFVVPITTAFGIVLTGLALYFLQDFKSQSLEHFEMALATQQHAAAETSADNSAVLATFNEIAASLSQASVYAGEMATMANSVDDAVTQVEETVLAILDTSCSLQGMAEKSAETSRQFKI